MVPSKKLKYDDPVVHINEEKISLVGEIRLLGLTIDRKLTFTPHVAKSIVLNASCAWAPATRKLSVKKKLNAVRCNVAVKACRAHRTVSLHSALILSRLFPLDIKASEVAYLYEVKRGKNLGDAFLNRKLEKLVYFGDLLHPAHVPEIGYESVEDLVFQA
ncbi:hypothetical protein EVAR_80752_1 [Eumeta japonica]|uniref:Uncharacterized protein n=1 Tax=Eumeta variegata TaxID=151549 RepID=A0A4C1XAU9_EUMVA|nr:hypothetical protein EVAR_80752_1 [Eumeta japonica]